MDLKKEFENLLKWGIQSPNNKKQVTQMISYLINSLNSSDKKELSKDELNKITASGKNYLSQPL